MQDEVNEVGLSIQDSLFPLPIKVIYSIPVNLGSADVDRICRGEDGRDYVPKDQRTGGCVETTPHAEWFCSRLADAVGIPTPPCAVLEMFDGSFIFGSAWEGGVIDPQQSGHWWDRVKSNEISLEEIKPILSKIYAFDQFIHNPDRHRNNFIVRNQKNGFVILAHDYSRAWLCAGVPLPATPFQEWENTINHQRWLSKFWGQDYILHAYCEDMLRRIKKIMLSNVSAILEAHPNSWLTESERDYILGWWGSAKMFKRIEEISKGIKDGSYL